MKRGLFAAVVLVSVGCNALTGVGDLSTDDDAVSPGDDASAPEASTSTDAGAPRDSGRDAAVDAPLDAPADVVPEGGDAGPTQKRVFATSTPTNGNLGGLAGADAKCMAAATSAMLGGTFVAYLSIENVVDARDRVTAAGPWYLVNGMLAVTKAELANAPITHAIDRDENGALVSTPDVWTATGGAGRFLDDDCVGWTSGSALAHAAVGDTNATGNAWVAASPDACNIANRLYCFEQ